MKYLIRLILCLATLLCVTVPAHAQKSRKLKAKYTWEIRNAQATKSLQIHTTVPADVPGRQKVYSVKFSVPPKRDFTEGGDRYVVFEFKAPDIPQEVIIEAEVEIFKSGLSAQKMRKKVPHDPDALNYLGSGRFITPQEPLVRSIAESLKGENPESTVKAICTYLATALTYKRTQPGRQGCLATLEKKTGVCSDYSDLMVAMCRANGIPARVSGGHVINGDFIPGWDKEEGHVWVDVYLEGYGWVPFEPTRSNPKNWNSFPANYIYTAHDYYNPKVSTHFHRWQGWQPRVDRLFSVK